MTAPPHRRRCARVLALALGLLAADALAQSGHRPTPSRRTVVSYDFEEPDNPFQVPGDFFRAQSDPDQGLERPGYPVYNKPAFSSIYARSGGQSVVLPVERGSACLRLRPGAVPIFPDADYHLLCYVRGQDVTHARFRLVGRLLDQNAQPIPGGEFRGSPVLPGDQWTPVELEIPGGVHDDAAFLQIDAELIQPERFRQPTLGEHQVWPEDFGARAWIDDLTVSQLPRIWVRTRSPGGIVTRPEQPELSFLVRDLTGEQLAARLTIEDSKGRVVFEDSRSIRSSAVPQRWSVGVSQLGWYRASLEIVAGDRVVGDARCALALVDSTTVRTDAQGGYAADNRARFMLHAEGWSGPVLEALPHIGRATATRGIAIGGWSASLDADNVRERTDAILGLLTDASHQWIDPVITLHGVPDRLQRELIIDTTDVLEALGTEHDVWADLLDPMLDRLGQIATRWRVGPSEPTPEFAPLEGDIATLRQELSTLVPGPGVGLVSPYHLAFPEWHHGALEEVALVFAPGTGAGVVGDAVERWAETSLAANARLTLAYDTRGADRYAADSVTAELIKRMILAEAAAAAGGVTIAHQLNHAWTVSDRDAIISPVPALPAWRAAIDRLSGRTVAAELAVTDGVRAFLLLPEDPDDPRGGAMVAWNESAAPGDAWVRTNLGTADLTRLDLWGNEIGTVETIAIESVAGQAIRLHQLPVSREPVFVEGIDVELAMFVASIRIDEPTVQTIPGPHIRNVLITNPWRIAIDGDVIILEPPERLPNGRRTGWDISPRVSRFSVGPGQTTAVPVEISFSSVELAGTKPFVVDVMIRSGPVQERLRAPSTIDLRLDGVELDARSVVDRAGVDVALEAVVTNVSAEPMDLTLHTATRGYPRQSATIRELAPGASTIRRFIFPDGVRRLSGSAIYVGVEDPISRGRLNKRVEIN